MKLMTRMTKWAVTIQGSDSRLTGVGGTLHQQSIHKVSCKRRSGGRERRGETSSGTRMYPVKGWEDEKKMKDSTQKRVWSRWVSVLF